jgi:prolyl-tRNA editing enzyme YbaK/EbsC (Cys-tRNA(Pro) deacylase)
LSDTSSAEELPPAAMRVRALLLAAGHSGSIKRLSETGRTAADAAAAIGCSVGEIAKSIVFRAASGRPVLVVASGSNRVDEKKIAAALGEAIGKADADFVRLSTGYAIGGVAPLGHAVSPAVFIDRDLLGFSTIWAAAGHSHAVFPTTPEELLRLAGGTVIEVAP